MRVLITGGAGFIGSHLADACIDRGDEVSVLDDLSTGSLSNIEHLIGHPRFHHTIDAVQNRAVTAELVDRADVVYHLAAAVGVRLIIENPIQTIENNLRGVEVILELAAKKQQRVLVASTSEVYGRSTVLPFREDGDLVLGPSTASRWSYACAKLMDEFLALAYNRGGKLPTVVVRLFNTVGPRQSGHYGMVLPNFVRQALAGEPITVFGDGTQSRCFGYVGDIVRGLVALMDHPDAAGEVFNVGATEEITMLNLAERVKALTGSSSPIVLIPYRDAYEDGFDDMPRRVPDLSKIGALVGYRATTTLDQTIEHVIQYHEATACTDLDLHKLALTQAS